MATTQQPSNPGTAAPNAGAKPANGASRAQVLAAMPWGDAPKADAPAGDPKSATPSEGAKTEKPATDGAPQAEPTEPKLEPADAASPGDTGDDAGDGQAEPKEPTIDPK